MAKEMITVGAIEAMLAGNPSLGESADLVVQVVGLKPVGSSNTRFTFMANDGKMKIKAMLPTTMAGEVTSGKLQNLGLIRILDYTCNAIQNQPQKVLIITKCEVVAPALDAEVGGVEVKQEDGDNIKPEVKVKTGDGPILKSAAQIVHDQCGNAAPAARMGISRRVYPLVSLNPYQGNWTIKVRVTNKGPLRTFRNNRGEGSVFNVELTDEDGTQIQATMFKEAADKFWDKFELGKVYYISKGSLRVANKQFKTVQNDYEMTLHANSEVEEATGEETTIPEYKHNFVKIDDLGQYVNSRELVDVIGVVQSVSTVLSIRRKSNNEEIPKRDITMADESKKTVTLSLWNDLAKKEGQELLDIVDSGPVIAVKGIRVGDYAGVSLSTTGRSTVMINPDFPEAQKLRSWYDTDGRGSSMLSLGSTLSGGTPIRGSRSLYSDRAFLSEITDPSVGEGKPAYFNVKVYISFIKPDQAMWYRACKTCNRKVTEEIGSGYWCEGCQKHEDESSLRYIMVVKASDSSGEAWLSVFNEHAEQILGHTADELAAIKSKEADEKAYQMELKKAMWVPHVFRVSVAKTEYMNETRQRITVRSHSPVDWVGECKYLIDEISKLKTQV
ncbi:replication protein A 70 kDa DNA-binding subunit B [Cryptomeria japonica]|uniref:replication protein A 70 kDa DNA-binding subunit B n=1 Tax=Cryptomeria japonica TaxID=3369 RepID=UPI0027DA4CA1|nr:replication protein A 70 kDa DNA-binding subunit B [Cryptomeria japonica]